MTPIMENQLLFALKWLDAFKSGLGSRVVPNSFPNQDSISINYVRYVFGGPPHPVIVTIRDNKDYVRVLFLIFLLYHYYRVRGPPKICCL